jgi:glyoxylase-like metal-dependent hydrolase (beta-lactamase superfamily II)
MKIADGLEMLELNVTLQAPIVINPTLIWDATEVVLIDTTAPGQKQVLVDAINNTDVAYEQISRILFTHHDADHIGEISTIAAEVAPVKLMASQGEKPYIQGDIPPIKMPPEPHSEKMKQEFARLKAPVDETLADGQELPFCGGIVVIETPGHTPGHTSYYLKQYRVLVSGDALNVVDGKLVGPNPIHTQDMPLAIKSLKKLLSYDIDAVICYHGGICRNEIKQQLRTIIAEQS